MKTFLTSILFLITSSCFEVVETKNYTIKSIRINNQEWMTTNLDISHFRNGDLILHAKTDEEWKQKFNERCKLNNKTYRLKLKETLGENIKPRGRPRKVIPPLIINSIFENL